MKNQTRSILIGSVIGLMSANAALSPSDYAVTIKNAVAADQTTVVEIVTEGLTAHPDLACEIVGGAIGGANANASTVALIVSSAIVALPDQAPLITKCALAAAPDASAEIYAVLAELGVNNGESSKSAKNATVAPADAPSNVLDFPAGPTITEGASNVVGPAPGMASGSAGGGGAGSIVNGSGGGPTGTGATSVGGGASTGGAGGGMIIVVPTSPTGPPTSGGPR